jgi:LPXTG-motif cell wall-anchored protein
MYTIKSDDPVKFYDGEGKEMTVFDLRKDMNIKATKITEAPRTAFVATATVTGTGPGRAASAAPAAAPAPTGTSRQTAAAAEPTAGASGTVPSSPRRLPKTASPLPLLGLAGLASLVTGLSLTARRRRQSR